MKKKKKMEKFGYITKCRKSLKQLCKVSAIVEITKQHLKDILRGFKLKLKIIKVIFKNHVQVLLSNFWSIPIMNQFIIQGVVTGTHIGPLEQFTTRIKTSD